MLAAGGTIRVHFHYSVNLHWNVGQRTQIWKCSAFSTFQVSLRVSSGQEREVWTLWRCTRFKCKSSENSEGNMWGHVLKHNVHKMSTNYSQGGSLPHWCAFPPSCNCRTPRGEDLMKNNAVWNKVVITDEPLQQDTSSRIKIQRNWYSQSSAISRNWKIWTRNKNSYFCFMRASRSATEVSFSIFASILPNV